MLCISAAYAVMRCLSVRLSRSWIMSKRINISSKFLSPSGSQTILVFPCQTGWRYSGGNPHNGVVECRWGRQKTQFWTNIWLRYIHCCQPYESRSVKNKAATNRSKRRAEHSARRPSSVVCTRRRRSVCDGFDVIRRTRRPNPPDTTPLVITPFSAAVGQSQRTHWI